MTSHHFDWRSGQVYTQQELKPIHHNGPSWVHESPFLRLGWEDIGKGGASSLKHTAMRQTISDQRNLRPELFANVPWNIASYLWDCLGRSKKRTMYMWKLYATVYPEQFGGVAPYHSMKIEGPLLPMRDYLNMVKSDSLRWRVVLTLTSSHARVPEVVEIANIKNLVALEIDTPPPRAASRGTKPPEAESEIPKTALNDRIARTWSDLARRSGAFAHLEVLRLRHQMDLTPLALQHLKAFPSLRWVLVYDCPGFASLAEIGSRGPRDGWEILEFSEYDWQPQLFKTYEANVKDVNKSDDETALSMSYPTLDFQVGQKRRQNKKSIQYGVVWLRRDPSSDRAQPEPEPVAKKLKVTPTEKKPVLKERKGKDLKGMLDDLM